MEQPTRALTDNERIELATHLSGSVSMPESQAWSDRIASDPAATAEASALNEAWEILDLLPMPMPKSDLSQRTLRLSLEANDPHLPSNSLTGQKVANSGSWAAVAWGTALALCAVGGYCTVACLPDSNQVFKARVQMLKQFDELRAVGDIEFLRALHQEKLLDRLGAIGAVKGEPRGRQ